MKLQLSDRFSYKKLFRFTLPAICMMIFTSIYGVIDGYFVSNFVGKVPFASINLIMPFLMILGTVGFMFGTGGSALVAKILGEGNVVKANKVFSMIIYSSALFGVALSILGTIFLPSVASFLGAEGELLDNAVSYGRIILLAVPTFILQNEFQCLFATGGKPNLGFIFTLISGCTNIVLDALLVAVFPLGIEGAAIATAISQFIGGFAPIIYFSNKNSSLLRLGQPYFNFKELMKICINGSSEFMSNISMSIVAMLYNSQLMKYAGENGVAAYGVLMYVNFIFISIFIGYSVGSSPIISFKYGSGKHEELKELVKKSLIIMSIFSISTFILAEVLATPLSMIYVGYDKTLFDMTKEAFFICSFSFLFSGIAIFSSSLFTALNNGLISALISFLRTLVFQMLAVLILPMHFELFGVWISVVVAEVLAVVFSVIFLIAKRKKYHY